MMHRDSRGVVPTILLFGGSDASGCAGLQIDLRTCAAFGVHGACAVTAVTAQSTTEVTGLHVVPAEFVTLQAETVQNDLAPVAIKTGMLASAANVSAIARHCERQRPSFVVVDPVLVSTTGGLLLEPSGIERLKTDLISRCSLITPNLAEAETLTGRPVRTRQDMREAARRLTELGAEAALVKGGHLAGDAIDVLCWPDGCEEFHGVRLALRHTRGTGCALASAITGALVRGLDLPEAVSFSKQWVSGAIEAGYPVGSGPGPIDALPLEGWSSDAPEDIEDVEDVEDVETGSGDIEPW